MPRKPCPWSCGTSIRRSAGYQVFVQFMKSVRVAGLAMLTSPRVCRIGEFIVVVLVSWVMRYLSAPP